SPAGAGWVVVDRPDEVLLELGQLQRFADVRPVRRDAVRLHEANHPLGASHLISVRPGIKSSSAASARAWRSSSAPLAMSARRPTVATVLTAIARVIASARRVAFSSSSQAGCGLPS